MYNLVRTRPLSLRLRPFDRTFDRAFDDLVDSFFSPSRLRQAGPTVASTWEDGALQLTVDLPGIPQEAVDVSVSGRALTIGVKTDRLSWQRTFSVGSSLDPEQVSAQYADGRLTVLVAPVPEAQPRRIEIETTKAPAIEAGETDQVDEADQVEGGEADTTATA
jgi:HSP20 family molecular chaperone IbpA